MHSDNTFLSVNAHNLSVIKTLCVKIVFICYWCLHKRRTTTQKHTHTQRSRFTIYIWPRSWYGCSASIKNTNARWMCDVNLCRRVVLCLCVWCGEWSKMSSLRLRDVCFKFGRKLSEIDWQFALVLHLNMSAALPEHWIYPEMSGFYFHFWISGFFT